MLNMIHKLSDVFLQNSGLDAENVQDALDTRFHDEIHDIISGESFDSLREMLNMQENPYKHPELMVHVAVYSVNLILLRATICGNSFTFTEGLGSADDWQKLTHIWRYAFSEEELFSLSFLIDLKHSDGAYALTYIYDEDAAKRAGRLSKLDKLLNISAVLGYEAEFAIFSSVRGEMTPQIDKILVKENLQLRTRYALNRLSESLKSFEQSKRDRDRLFRAMEELYCCLDDGDLIDLLVYYMLLRVFAEQGVLSRQNISRLLRRDGFMWIDKSLCFTSNFSLHNLLLRKLWAV